MMSASPNPRSAQFVSGVQKRGANCFDTLGLFVSSNSSVDEIGHLLIFIGFSEITPGIP